MKLSSWQRSLVFGFYDDDDDDDDDDEDCSSCESDSSGAM